MQRSKHRACRGANQRMKVNKERARKIEKRKDTKRIRRESRQKQSRHKKHTQESGGGEKRRGIRVCNASSQKKTGTQH